MEGELINTKDYNPLDDDLFSYAKYIGIDVFNERKLLFLAKEGLSAPLPDEWKAFKNKKNEIYFQNEKTKE